MASVRRASDRSRECRRIGSDDREKKHKVRENASPITVEIRRTASVPSPHRIGFARTGEGETSVTPDRRPTGGPLSWSSGTESPERAEASAKAFSGFLAFLLFCAGGRPPCTPRPGPGLPVRSELGSRGGGGLVVRGDDPPAPPARGQVRPSGLNWVREAAPPAPGWVCASTLNRVRGLSRGFWFLCVGATPSAPRLGARLARPSALGSWALAGLSSVLGDFGRLERVGFDHLAKLDSPVAKNKQAPGLPARRSGSTFPSALQGKPGGGPDRRRRSGVSRLDRHGAGPGAIGKLRAHGDGRKIGRGSLGIVERSLGRRVARLATASRRRVARSSDRNRW